MGPYDNELGCHVEDPGIENGQWLEDAGHNLWIIPYWPGEVDCPKCGVVNSTEELGCAECGANINVHLPENRKRLVVRETVSDVEGPEGVATFDRKRDVLKSICLILQKNGGDRLTSTDMKKLGLREVPNGLKRFNSNAGYFHA